MFRRPRISVVSLSAALLCPCAMAAAANKKPPLHPINLNTASPTELQEMRGIGPVAADKILKIRKIVRAVQKRGRFTRYQGNCSETPGEDAEVSYRDPAESEKTVSATRKNSPHKKQQPT